MTLRDRRSHPLFLALVLAAGALTGLQCGAGMGAADQESKLIRIEPSRIWITVENTSGESLQQVLVQMVPHGESTIFAVSPTTLAAGESRDFPIANFRGRDGTPLDLRVARIKSVRVNATTAQGKPVQAEVRWK